MMPISSLLAIMVLSISPAADMQQSIHLRIEVMNGDGTLLSDAGIVGECYILPEEECSGLIYISDDGSGMRMGRSLNDPLPLPCFAVLYGLAVTSGVLKDTLVGSAYAMRLSSEGEILGGSRTEIRRQLFQGPEVALAFPRRANSWWIGGASAKGNHQSANKTIRNCLQFCYLPRPTANAGEKSANSEDLRRSEGSWAIALKQ